MLAPAIRWPAAVIRPAGPHPFEPDVGQRLADALGIILPVAPAAEELLNQIVISHHAQESPRCQQGIDAAKLPGADALADVVGQRLVVVRHVGPEKAVREAMVFQRAKKQQPAQRAVRRVAPQRARGDGGEHSSLPAAAVELALELLAAARRFAFGGQHRPGERVLLGEVAEEDGLVHPDALGDAARRRSAEPPLRKQPRRGAENLPATLGGGDAVVGAAHCK